MLHSFKLQEVFSNIQVCATLTFIFWHRHPREICITYPVLLEFYVKLNMSVTPPWMLLIEHPMYITVPFIYSNWNDSKEVHVPTHFLMYVYSFQGHLLSPSPFVWSHISWYDNLFLLKVSEDIELFLSAGSGYCAAVHKIRNNRLMLCHSRLLFTIYNPHDISLMRLWAH